MGARSWNTRSPAITTRSRPHHQIGARWPVEDHRAPGVTFRPTSNGPAARLRSAPATQCPSSDRRSSGRGSRRRRRLGGDGLARSRPARADRRNGRPGCQKLVGWWWVLITSIAGGDGRDRRASGAVAQLDDRYPITPQAPDEAALAICCRRSGVRESSVWPMKAYTPSGAMGLRGARAVVHISRTDQHEGEDGDEQQALRASFSLFKWRCRCLSLTSSQRRGSEGSSAA